MSKIVKKKQLDVLIESTLKKAGIEPKKEVKKKVVTEDTKAKKEVITESNENFKNELAKFNKLTNFNYKY